MIDPGTISHAEAAHVLRLAAYPDEFIREVLSQLPDPIDFRRDSEMLLRYGLSRQRLMERRGASP